MNITPKYLIVIAGPTAIGKTNLAIQLAKEFNTVVISADSRQFYKEMTIGTAKPLPQEMQGITHFFINSHSVMQELNAGNYEKEALQLLEDLYKTHQTVVLVGGSGLFINTLLNGVDDLPEKDETLRVRLNKTLEKEGIVILQNQLKELDEEYYNQVDISNPQRVIRAIEVCLLSGKKYSELRKNSQKSRAFISIKIALDMPREELYERINKRVNLMIENGLIDEVKTLLTYKNLNALNTVGYKELFEYLDGKQTLNEAVELIKKNSRNYAKRQLTWFRKDKEYKWFNPADISSIVQYIKKSIL